MPVPELTALIDRAEHLLWVLARADVENLSGHRADILRQLGALEDQALRSGVPDLYEKVLLANPDPTKIML